MYSFGFSVSFIFLLGLNKNKQSQRKSKTLARALGKGALGAKAPYFLPWLGLEASPSPIATPLPNVAVEQAQASKLREKSISPHST
jgi:hypothetical protein